MNLQGKTVVITGANGGLGKVVAERARELGASLVLLDIAFSAVDLEREENGVSRVAVDLCDQQATAACIDGLAEFDVVFNLAGGFDMGPAVHEITDEQWDHLFKLNVTTLRNVVRATVPRLLVRGRGAMVNVGAIGARQGLPNMGAYCASKAVVMRLTESLSAELRDKGINVNAVLPSVIDTPANRTNMPDADFSKWVTPAQLADAICFLASDAASGVHGALVPVSGLS